MECLSVPFAFTEVFPGGFSLNLAFLTGSTGQCSVFLWQQAWVVVYCVAMSFVPYNATEVAQGSTDNSDESMNGQGRAPRCGPIVVEPDDRLGPMDEEPARHYYQLAPLLWKYPPQQMRVRVEPWSR